jgi:hypothetical protein
VLKLVLSVVPSLVYESPNATTPNGRIEGVWMRVQMAAFWFVTVGDVGGEDAGERTRTERVRKHLGTFLR